MGCELCVDGNRNIKERLERLMLIMPRGGGRGGFEMELDEAVDSGSKWLQTLLNKEIQGEAVNEKPWRC